MKIINISQKHFQNLKMYKPNCINTEAELYYFNQKNKWIKENKILKKFFITNGINFSNKMFTINSLIDYQDEINIESLVIPNCLLSINSQIVGYVMDLIDGYNLSQVLYNPKVTITEKIQILKQIGDILNQMKKIRKFSNIDDFFIGDLHEDNIIINTNGQLKIIDTDSFKILNNMSSPSKYLQNLKRKHIINQKYQLDPINKDIIQPKESTDYYCYCIIVLNTLFQADITKLDMKDFYNYLEYLKKIGINKELIDNFMNIYTNKPNENIGYLLDSIGKEAYQAHNKVFQLKTHS